MHLHGCTIAACTTAACTLRAGFAVVKKGRDKRTGQVVAIKVWLPEPLMHTTLPNAGVASNVPFKPAAACLQVVDKWRYTSEENSEREIRILSRVSHVNCIKMHAVYVTTRRVYIVTELVTGGELLDKCASLATPHSGASPINLPRATPTTTPSPRSASRAWRAPDHHRLLPPVAAKQGAPPSQ